MAEARYGRRKQRNPKRKNVESEEVHDETIVKKVKDLEESIVQEAGDKIQGPPTQELNAKQHNDSSKEDDSSVKDEGEATQEDHPDKENAPTANGVHNSSSNHLSLPLKLPQKESSDIVIPRPCTGSNVNCVSEEEKIQEYLNRSDTAVIYAEAVSDCEHHEEEEKEEEDRSTKSDPTYEDPTVIQPDEEIILKCIYCNESYTRANLLRDHMKMRHPDKTIKYLCPKCDDTFLLKSQLDKHIALHSPTSQSCRICNKTFANVYRLQRHMISHDESNDLRKFKCPECGKAFKFKHHLKEHIRIHSGEKPFACRNCGKRFSHSGSYSSHMTSKKCFVLNQNKPRHQDRTTNASTIISSNSTMCPPVTSAGMESMMHPLHGGKFPHGLVPFDPTKPAIPAYFSPPSGSFLPMAFAVKPGGPLHPMMAPFITPPTTVECLTSTHLSRSSPSRSSENNQISPDVNCNTQVIYSKSGDSSSKTEITSAVKVEPAPKPSTPANTKQTYEEPETHVDQVDMIKTEKEEECEKAADVESVKQENDGTAICKHCGEAFSNPIHLHQHERYLCKQNKDISHRMSGPESVHSSPMSERSHTPNDCLSPESDADDIPEDPCKSENGLTPDGSEKKYRMRSMINDEQQAVLKSHYKANPRPRKYELVRIGNEIGLEKRVVQVWFQNQRARDRKKGVEVPYFPAMARFKRQDSPSLPVKDSKSPAPIYIPNVPTPYAHTKINGTVTPLKPADDQPLDLSFKPPEAHSGSRPKSQTPPHSWYQDSPLAINLSKKPADVAKNSADGSLRNSAIFKYMQQEGMFHGHRAHLLPHAIIPPSPSIICPINTPVIPKRDSSTPNSIPHVYTPAEPEDKTKTPKATTGIKMEASSDNRSLNGSIEADDSMSDDSDDSSNLSIDSRKKAMEDATHNIATLAEVSLANGNIPLSLNSSGKSKRLRKKSWRQVHSCDLEAEALQMELDESLLDEDQPYKKKRRSWKPHRSDSSEETGLYSCDQCKKMFSKQSSLARHKYEHSGARPFNCDMCGKAFKHKHHLTEHSRLHSGEKPFQCKKCGKRFSHSGSYSQHMNHRYKYCKPSRSEDGNTSS